ncbi:MAG: hypothetical protein RL693_251 [Verrucomicrobiota bacterium]|jgi:phosphatidate cytidylyltransferase
MSETPVSAPPGSSPSKGHVFFVRLGSTVVLWALMGFALTMKLDWIFLATVAIFGVLGTMEYLGLQKADLTARRFGRLVLFLSLSYWALVMWQSLPGSVEHPWWIDLGILMLALQGSFLLAFTSQLEGEHTLRRIFNTIFAVVYTVLTAGFLSRVLFLEGAPSGRYLLFLLIMVTKFGDMGAYSIGSLIGKHKMVPHISPAKTWQGFGGAIFGSYVAMAVMMYLVPEKLLPLNWMHAMILAPLLSVSGIMGDLAESVLKRCHHIKDSGHKLPGIGGILDLTDSLLFTAPVAYFYLRAIS